MKIDRTKLVKMQRMIGTRPPNIAIGDWDKDGRVNIIDCEPRNPKKHGIVSWIQAKAQGRTHTEIEEARYKTRREAAIGAAEERAKQTKETAIYREKQRGERRRQVLKSGGAAYYIGGTAKWVGSALKAPKPRYKYVTKKRKKKKGKKLKRTRIRTAPSSAPSFKMDMPKFNF